jgi:hypothetical protein
MFLSPANRLTFMIVLVLCFGVHNIIMKWWEYIDLFGLLFMQISWLLYTVYSYSLFWFCLFCMIWQFLIKFSYFQVKTKFLWNIIIVVWLSNCKIIYLSSKNFNSSILMGPISGPSGFRSFFPVALKLPKKLYSAHLDFSWDA